MKAISNTSPLIFLHSVDGLAWLDELFEEVWVPTEVIDELLAGQTEGHPAPTLDGIRSIRVVSTAQPPSEWLALDLGLGELSAMSLALANPEHVVLLDDALARRVALAAGLTAWGTLRILLEAKALGVVDRVEPVIDALLGAGMWLSQDVRTRILRLAGEI